MKCRTSRLSPVGKIIVKALADQNMNKTELAQAVGVSQPYLSYILYGLRSGHKYLPKIVAALGLDPDEVESATAA